MLHKLTSKLVFACPHSYRFPHFFGFLFSHACLLWVAVIFSDNRSTRLLPKGPFELLKRTKLLKSGILSCKLVHYHDRVFQSFKPISQRLCIRKLLVLELLTQKRFNLWKRETWRRKWCSWELSRDGDGESFPVGHPFRIQSPKLFR